MSCEKREITWEQFVDIANEFLGDRDMDVRDLEKYWLSLPKAKEVQELEFVNGEARDSTGCVVAWCTPYALGYQGRLSRSNSWIYGDSSQLIEKELQLAHRRYVEQFLTRGTNEN